MEQIFNNVMSQIRELMYCKNIEAEWLIVDDDTLQELKANAEPYLNRIRTNKEPDYLKFAGLKIAVASCPPGEKVLEVK